MKSKLNQNDKAFTLIELTIYMALFSILITTFFIFFNQIQRNLLRRAKENDKFIKSCLTLDLLKRDLSSADPNILNWDLANLVFTKSTLNLNNEKITKNISWEVIRNKTLSINKLRRIEGIFDFKTRKWNKRIVSLVYSNAKELKYKLFLGNDHKFVESVDIFLELEGKIFQEKIFLQNRCF